MKHFLARFLKKSATMVPDSRGGRVTLQKKTVFHDETVVFQKQLWYKFFFYPNFVAGTIAVRDLDFFIFTVTRRG